MRNDLIICTKCWYAVSKDLLEEYEGVDGFMYHCPVCNKYQFTIPYTEEDLKVEEVKPKIDVALNSDEIRYTIHCLLKQEDKLKNALSQIHNTITKLDIMLECAIEKENN